MQDTPALTWAQQNPDRWLMQAFGAVFWDKQREILESFRDNPVTLVPSAHASGKSFVAAHAFLWALYTHPNCKVLTTATTWHQVESILWSEIRAAWARKLVDLGGPVPQMTSIEIAPGWRGSGISTNNPVSLQGQHAPGGVFMIVDEGDGIADEMWDGIKANLSTGDCRLLVIGNPVDPESRFARMCSDPVNKVLPISAFDTPNFTSFGLTLQDFIKKTWKEKIAGLPLPMPYLLSPQWVADSLREEGVDGPFFISRVLAKWPDVRSDSLISPRWIEAAQARWDSAKTGRKSIGVDVARFGDDKTVIVLKDGEKLRVSDVAGGLDTEQVADLARRRWALEGANASVFVDADGLGAGVYDKMKRYHGCTVIAIQGAEKAREFERFENTRSELWWNMREALRTGTIALDPYDKILAADLSSVRFEITGKGRVKIEPKDELKKRLGRSPDRGDAAVYANAIDRAHVTAFIEAMREKK